MSSRRSKLCKLVGDLYGSLPYTDDVPSEADLVSLTDLQLVKLAYRVLDVVTFLRDEEVVVDWRALEIVYEGRRL